MFRSARAAGSDQRYARNLSDGTELRDIVALTNTVAGHAVQHNLTSTPILHFTNPIQCFARCLTRAVRIACELIDVIIAVDCLAVDANDDALSTEARVE